MPRLSVFAIGPTTPTIARETLPSGVQVTEAPSASPETWRALLTPAAILAARVATLGDDLADAGWLGRLGRVMAASRRTDLEGRRVAKHHLQVFTLGSGDLSCPESQIGLATIRALIRRRVPFVAHLFLEPTVLPEAVFDEHKRLAARFGPDQSFGILASTAGLAAPGPPRVAVAQALLTSEEPAKGKSLRGAFDEAMDADAGGVARIAPFAGATGNLTLDFAAPGPREGAPPWAWRTDDAAWLATSTHERFDGLFSLMGRTDVSAPELRELTLRGRPIFGFAPDRTGRLHGHDRALFSRVDVRFVGPEEAQRELEREAPVVVLETRAGGAILSRNVESMATLEPHAFEDAHARRPTPEDVVRALGEGLEIVAIDAEAERHEGS